MPTWPWRKVRPGVDLHGRSPLWWAAEKGNLTDIKAEIRSGADATAADKDGFTSLHVASQNGHVEAVALLLKNGADANATDRHGNGPLWTAGYRGGEEGFAITAALLAAGADPHRLNKVGRSAVFWATVNEPLRDIYVRAGVVVPPPEKAGS